MKRVIGCPYCGEEIRFDWDCREGFDYRIDCKECKNTVMIVSKVFNTCKAFKSPQFCEQNENRHRYKEMKYVEISNVYECECTVCGEMRSDTDERPNRIIRDQIEEDKSTMVVFHFIKQNQPTKE